MRPHHSQSPFALFFAGDAYSTDRKIMGRQSAGKSFLRGVAQRWPAGSLAAVGYGADGGRELEAQLQSRGFQGSVNWSALPNLSAAAQAGTLYYPAPPNRELALIRDRIHPAAFSQMGITHTLSSVRLLDELAAMVLPPFRSWDALICTSRAAHTFVTRLQEETKDYWRRHVGATHFADIQLPVIPLGINVDEFTPDTGELGVRHRAEARRALGLEPQDVAFLFAGRLSFHAKSNPAPVYQALQRVAQRLVEASSRHDHDRRTTRIVCIEAGVYANQGIRTAYEEARALLAPGIRFIWVDGQDEAAYRSAWKAADVFVSLSDNIQETFGLTPVEAMASGLPVLVSDWDGYKDTVQDGVEGLRVRTILPPAGAGQDLADRHGLEVDTYDRHIGHVSLATVVDTAALTEAAHELAVNPDRRRQMGEAAQARARSVFDWSCILQRYEDLTGDLAERRRAAAGAEKRDWPARADPFLRFSHFSSERLSGHWRVAAAPASNQRLENLLKLSMANYGLASVILPAGHLSRLLSCMPQDGDLSINDLLQAAGMAHAPGLRGLMWLLKFDVIRLVKTRAAD